MDDAAKLTPAQKRRYARQLLLREIGEAGQLRLAAARVRIPAGAHARAGSIAADYLVRAGLTLAEDAGRGDARSEIEVDLPDDTALRALCGTPALEEAGAALCGAFAAVEALKAALEIGVRASLPAELNLAAKPSP